MVNVTNTVQLFPTVVQEFEYVAEQKLIDAIQEEEVIYSDKSHYSSRQSVDNNLMNKKEFKNLKNKILQTTKEVCKFYSYKYEKIDIVSPQFSNDYVQYKDVYKFKDDIFKNASKNINLQDKIFSSFLDDSLIRKHITFLILKDFYNILLVITDFYNILIKYVRFCPRT